MPVKLLAGLSAVIAAVAWALLSVSTDEAQAWVFRDGAIGFSGIAIGLFITLLQKGRGPSKKEVENLRGELEQYRNAIREEVEGLLKAAYAYDESLERTQRRLEKASGLNDTRQIMRILAEEIRTMREANGQLKRQLQVAASQIQDQTDNIRELSKAATSDALTGVFNRGQFDKFHAEFSRRMTSRGDFYGLMLLDLDHFKRINDTIGHQAGDLVLTEVAKILRRTVRRSDIVARYGGEEFGVLLQDVNDSTLIDIAEKIRKEIAAATLRYEGETISVTASVGVVMAELGQTPKDTLKVADQCLYLAKEQGRNKVRSHKHLGKSA